MPLVYQQNINDSAKIGVWHITEPESFFSEQITIQKEINHPHKRLQHLAGRFILMALDDKFPVDLIRIAETKRPFLENDLYHFSVSHSGDYAAAIISKTNRVGVDVELPNPKIGIIKNKFITEKEVQLFSTLTLSFEQQLTLAWSIKESMFKWYAEDGIDFKKHLCIENVIVSNNEFRFDCIVKKGIAQKVIVSAIEINDSFLTWIC